MPDKPTKTGDVLNAATDYLRAQGVPEADNVCRLFLSRLLTCRPLDIPLHRDVALSEKYLQAMRRAVKRAATGEPVQYILGETEFMGHTFKVDQRALIPRPDTEILVEKVLACEALWKNERPAIVDVGTGSGCIAISLALAHPEAVYLALDTNPEALGLARENAVALGVSDMIGFSEQDLADLLEPESADALIANPPYIRTEEIQRLARQVRDHEPHSALDGGPDGLGVIRDIVMDASIVLRAGGRIFLEIGYDQADVVRPLLQEAGFSGVTVSKDLGKNDRVVQAVLSESGL